MSRFTSNKSIIVIGTLILITVLTGLYLVATVALRESAHHEKPRIVPSSSIQKKPASERQSSNADASVKDQDK